MQLKALLVDLDAETIALLGDSPICSDIALTVSNDDEEILSLISGGSIDLVLMDARGIELVARELISRIADTGKQVPVLLLCDGTGAGQCNAGEPGVVDCIVRSAGSEALIGAVGKVARQIALKSEFSLSDGRFRAIFNHNPLAGFCWQWDGEDLILSDVNAAAGRLSGAEIYLNIGRRLSDFNQPDQRVVDALYRCRETGVSVSLELEDYRSWPNGAIKAAELHIAACPPDIVLLHIQDIQERIRVKRAFNETETSLREAQDLARIGTWRWDIETGKVEWTEHVYRIFGLDPREFTPQIDSILALSPWPEGLNRGRDIQDAINNGQESGTYEQRFLKPDGSIGWYFSSYRGIFGAGGELIAIKGTVQDITELKRALTRVQQSEFKYRTLFENMAQGAFQQNADGRLVDCNQASLDILGVTREEFLGRSSDTPEWKVFYSDGGVMPPERLPSMIALNTGKPVRDVEVGVFNPVRQEVVWMNVNAIPHFEDGSKKPTSVFVTLHDITLRVRTLEQLRANERMLARSQAVANLGSYVFHTDTLTWTSSEVLDRIFGIDERDARNVESWLNLVHPEDRQMMKEHLADHVLGQGNFFDKEYRIIRANDKAVRWVHGLGELDFDEDGNILTMHGTIQDITEAHEAEEALRESVRFNRQVMNCVQEGFIVYDRQLRYRVWNRYMEDISGISADHALGKRAIEVFPWLEDVGVTKCLDRALDGETPEHIQFEFTDAKTGAARWARDTCMPLRDAEGNVQGVIGIVIDITEAMLAQEALDRSEQRFQHLFESMYEGMVGVDFEGEVGRFTLANPAAERLFNVEPGKLVGRKLADFIAPDEQDRLDEQRLKRQQGEISTYEMSIVLPRGERKIIRVSATPRTDDTGKIVGSFSLLQDITEQKRALEALQTSEKRYFDLFQEMSSGFALHEMIYDDAGRPCDYRFLEINPAFERLTGLDATELIGNTVMQKLPNTEDFWIRKYASVVETGEPITFENYAVELDKHFEVTAYRPSPCRFAVVFTDVTSRRKAEINLEWELKLNEAMVELSRQLLVPGKDFYNIACDVLDQARELTGAEHGFVSSIDLISKDMICHTLTNMMGRECEMDWAEGRIAFPIGADGSYPSLWGVCLNTGDAFYTNVPADHAASRGLPGKHVRLENYLAAPAIIGAEVAGMVALANLPGGFTDKHLEAVSRIASLYALALEFERHLQALEEKENELRQTQKLEAIGNLAGGIAHDFNNVLYAIMGNAELAQSVMKDGEPAWKNVTEILKASKRAAELVKQILTFARRTSREREVISVGPVIDEVIRMSRSTIPVTIDISAAISNRDAQVFADPTELHQVLLNLCTNAFHAVQDTGGRILVEAGVVSGNDAELAAGGLPKIGDYVRIRVSDDGTGMSQQIKLQIFEPFFTTKEAGHGTGMGLAVVHGIVKGLGGEILVDSTEGVGTTFSIYLPRALGDLSQEAPEGSEPQAGAERILLVDDEQELTTMINILLTKRGYEVDCYNSSSEALENFKVDPDRYDLAILDHTMPGMTGGELAQIMLLRKPDLPIILCTGYSYTMSADKAREIGVREFLLKPISIKTLTMTIRQLLDNPVEGEKT